MAHVSTVRFCDRSRLPHAVSSRQPARVIPPLRRSKSDIPSRTVIKRDVSETLQQAALINIVAAVNGGIHGDSGHDNEANVPGSAIDSLKNTVAVITNLMTPRHRSVSIPKQQQKVFTMSDNIVQKKPVYYRHSDDDDTANQQETAAEYSKGRTKIKTTDAELMCPSPVQSVRIMPVKKTYNDADFKLIESNLRKSETKPTTKHPECAKSAKSSVRTLGMVKKAKPRKVHEISKCDAVDFTESSGSYSDNKNGDTDDPFKAILDSSRKMIPQNVTEPYIRPKSLPGAFPAKVKKFNRVKSSPPGKQQIYKNKNPIARSISRDSEPCMYSRMMSLPGGFGFESLAIGNGVNQEPDVFSPLSHDSTRTPNPKISFTGLISQRHSRRFGTPRTAGTNSGESLWSTGSTTMDNRTDLSPEPASRLHESIESAMGRVSNRDDLATDNKENERCITPVFYRTHYAPQDTTRRRTPRKVQFDSREVTMSSDESGGSEAPAPPVVHGGSSIIQMPVSGLRSYSPAIQPMSAHELLRFKQRIIPANVPASLHQRDSSYPPFFATSSVMNIKQLRQKHAPHAPVSVASRDLAASENEVDDRGADSDAELEDYISENADTECQRFLKCSPPAEVTGVSEKSVHSAGKLPPPANIKAKEEIVDIQDSESAEEKHDFYKLIKAIDTHDYAGFAHKKLRRLSDMGPGAKGVDKQKEHYVKVKVA